MFNKIWKVYKEKSKRSCQTVREYIIVKSRGKKKPKLSNTTYFHTNRNITAKNKWEKRLRINCKSREHWNNVIVLIIKTKIEVLLSKIGNDYVAGENLTCVHLLLSILWSSDDCTDTTINAVCKTTDFLISEL